MPTPLTLLEFHVVLCLKYRDIMVGIRELFIAYFTSMMVVPSDFFASK